jgi:two-component system sensor histidine kinase KdpD
MSRGSLRIYLGASPGVGKTYSMLGEGVRRNERGTDVVVGLVETHGRPQTIAQLGNLEFVPRQSIEYRGTVLEEMDVAAILARRPEVALVDEFAHTNVPGSRHDKRWQDVEELLDAGIDVISTLNIQHLESLNDVVTRITGTVQRETVPDALVRRADQIELVDMSPEAIRRRMAHGNIYKADKVDAALANYFRPGNLGALRELALLWVADRVEDSLQDYLDAHDISDTWETRERVVVGLTGIASGEALIRRAARMAGRLSGDLIGVHVSVDDGLSSVDGPSLDTQRRLVTELGGETFEVVGHDPVEALVTFAASAKATQLVLGATRRSRWHEIVHGSFIARVTRQAANIDVHVIATPDEPVHQRRTGRVSPDRSRTDRWRLVVAWLLTVIGLPGLTGLATAFRDRMELSTVLLLFLSLVLVIAALGGRWVAAVAAVGGSLLVNWYFVDPIHTLTITQPQNLVALVVFVVVAVTFGTLVDNSARRTLQARRAGLEAEALARSAASLAAEPDPLPLMLEQIRTTFGLSAVVLRSASADDPGDDVVAGDRQGAPLSLQIEIAGRQPGSEHLLELHGRALSTEDQRVLHAIADQLIVAVENQRLAREAAEAAALTETDAVRTAMLRAVSHDLRTPLASIKALVSGLRDTGVRWTPTQTADALETVEDETDRLNALVGNLLDASRLQIGALAVAMSQTSIADTVATCLHSLGPSAQAVQVDPLDGLPLVMADSVLLERSLANVIVNALRYTPPGEHVRVQATAMPGAVHILVIDRGPGIPRSDRSRVLLPFQRLGDQQTSDGVGLGLSIAQGFINAMGATLTLDDTPGGGLTVTITLTPIEEPDSSPFDRDPTCHNAFS